ncbi:MAG TPA: sulfite exporter TauE/SafE family protein [Bryobacteraceae bacterium]|nr:sulfite exporter TauE/SafE family protein [Bryobacteraceae bacterium]
MEPLAQLDRLLHYRVTPSEIALLLSVAGVAGALNSIAGGGSFLSFPLLLFLGIPSVNANATNTVALWPGTIASTGAYRKALSVELLRRMLPLVASTLAGSLVGAWLLLHTRQHTFDKLVPWLLLAGTVLFSLRGRVTGWAAKPHQGGAPAAGNVVWITVAQGLLGVYVGYFGAGVGIVMLPLLVLMGVENIHSMSGLRTLIVTCGNAVAVAVFVLAHAVYWPQALLMTLGASAGGYAGAYWAQKMQPRTVSYLVITIGSAMSLFFFWKTYVAW